VCVPFRSCGAPAVRPSSFHSSSSFSSSFSPSSNSSSLPPTSSGVPSVHHCFSTLTQIVALSSNSFQALSLSLLVILSLFGFVSFVLFSSHFRSVRRSVGLSATSGVLQSIRSKAIVSVSPSITSPATHLHLNSPSLNSPLSFWFVRLLRSSIGVYTFVSLDFLGFRLISLLYPLFARSLDLSVPLFLARSNTYLSSLVFVTRSSSLLDSTVYLSIYPSSSSDPLDLSNLSFPFAFPAFQTFPLVCTSHFRVERLIDTHLSSPFRFSSLLPVPSPFNSGLHLLPA
jgi:hypothetical protein